jgi:sec-independent protein translocase protein TatC
MSLEENPPPIEGPVSFFDHISELRKRLIAVSILVTLIFLALWSFRNDLLNIYLLPLKASLEKFSGEVVFLRITDRFIIHLKTCFFFTVVAAIPFIFYQAWRFVSPGLYSQERRVVSLLSILTTLLFYTGMAVAYFVIIPFGFNFLVQYSATGAGHLGEQVMATQLTFSLSEQVGLTQKFLLVFGFMFQTPLVMLTLCKSGFVAAESFSSFRRVAIVLVFVVAAILTPPDPITMIGLALPLVALYEFGVLLCKLLGPKSSTEVQESAVEI